MRTLRWRIDTGSSHQQIDFPHGLYTIPISEVVTEFLANFDGFQISHESEKSRFSVFGEDNYGDDLPISESLLVELIISYATKRSYQ